MRAFEYHRPRTVVEACEILHQSKSETRVLAGGQSLLNMMKWRLAAPECLIDGSKLQELRSIGSEAGRTTVGSMVTYSEVASSRCASQAPILQDALQVIADLQVRNVGTLGGSCCQADPYGDMPNVMVALGAEMTVQSVGGPRRIPAEAFFVGPLQTALTSAEILTAMHFDSDVTGSAYEKFSWRKGDYAIVSVACRLDVNSRREISQARVVVGGLGRGPARFKAAEDFITGKPISSDALLDNFVIEEGALLIEPDAVYGSAEYKQHLVGVMSRKCIAKAAVRIRKGN